MAKILFVSSSDIDRAAKKAAIEQLQNAGHEVTVTTVFNQTDALAAYEQAPSHDLIVLSNLTSLEIHHSINPELQDPLAFARTLSESGKPLMVYDVLEQDLSEDLATMIKGIRIYDSHETTATAFPAEVDAFLKAASARAAGAGR